MGAKKVESDFRLKGGDEGPAAPSISRCPSLAKRWINHHGVANAAPVRGAQVLQSGSLAHRGSRGPRHFEESLNCGNVVFPKLNMNNHSHAGSATMRSSCLRPASYALGDPKHSGEGFNTKTIGWLAPSISRCPSLAKRWVTPLRSSYPTVKEEA